MKNLILILIALTTLNIHSFDDDGRESYDCKSAIETAMNDCTYYDYYDQDDWFDEDCIENEMQSYGFPRSSYELSDSLSWPRPGYNEFICSDN